MDPLRSDPRPAEALSGAERDARIEQLLLAGLDEYFAHRYEHAVNLWTRVLFFDRQHDRARAYIERARRAQAELQRESEAALHQAIDAIRAGEVARARDLVAQALDHGASPDEAHGMLERIERLGVAQTSPQRRRRALASSGAWAASATTALENPHARHLPTRLAAALLAVASLGVLAVAAWGLTNPEVGSWGLLSSPAAPPSAIPWIPEPLPVAQASERPLARARGLAARGRVHDALTILDQIPVGDPLRRDADLLRAEVQQRLLSLATKERPPE